MSALPRAWIEALGCAKRCSEGGGALTQGPAIEGTVAPTAIPACGWRRAEPLARLGAAGAARAPHTPLGTALRLAPAQVWWGGEEGSIWPLLCLVHPWERKAWFSSNTLNKKPWKTIPPELSNPLWLNISMPEDWWGKDVAPVGNYKFAPFSVFYSDCSISTFSLCLRCVRMHSAVSGALLSYSCAHTLGKILILSGRSKTYVWSFGIGKQEERNRLRVMTWYNC